MPLPYKLSVQTPGLLEAGSPYPKCGSATTGSLAKRETTLMFSCGILWPTSDTSDRKSPTCVKA